MNQENTVSAPVSATELQTLRKDLLRTRIFCMISSVLTICLLVAVIVFTSKLSALLQFAESTAPKLDQLLLFTEEIKPALNEISGFIKSSAPAIDHVSSVDVEALNNTLERLENLDTEALTKSLKTLNNVVDTLTNVANRISSAFSFFGNN